jgi:hypothetical protein
VRLARDRNRARPKAVGNLAALDDGTGRYMASPNDASPTSRALFDGVAELGSKIAQSCGSLPERF